MAEVFVVPTTATGASLAYDLVSATAGFQYVKLADGLENETTPIVGTSGTPTGTAFGLVVAVKPGVAVAATVTGTVQVSGPVQVSGTVSVSGALQASGTVSVSGPISTVSTVVQNSATTSPVFAHFYVIASTAAPTWASVTPIIAALGVLATSQTINNYADAAYLADIPALATVALAYTIGTSGGTIVNWEVKGVLF